MTIADRRKLTYSMCPGWEFDPQPQTGRRASSATVLGEARKPQPKPHNRPLCGRCCGNWTRPSEEWGWFVKAGREVCVDSISLLGKTGCQEIRKCPYLPSRRQGLPFHVLDIQFSILLLFVRSGLVYGHGARRNVR